jgi:hypothetical protein
MNRKATLSVLLTVVVVLSTFAFVGSASNASITAEPDTAGETSTHTVVATVGSDAAGSSWTGLNVDYGGTGTDISNVGQNDIVRIGIDEDDDGTIEVDTSDDVSSVGSSNNGETLEIGLGGNYDLQDGDHVIVEYDDAQNPDAGDYQIDFVVNPQSAGDVSSGTLSISEASTATPTPTPTPTPSETATPTPTPTPTPSATSTPTPTATATPFPSETPTPTPTPTQTDSDGSTGGGGGGGGDYDDTPTPTSTVAMPTATPTPDGAEAGDGIADAGDVTVETTVQPIYDLRVNDTAVGQDGVDVYINVTSLKAADFDLDSLNVRVNESDVNNATLVDQNVNQNDGNTTVRATFDVDEGHTAFSVDAVWLTQLGPGNADPTEDLRHYIAVSGEERLGDEAPNRNDAVTESYSVLSEQDPDADGVMNADFNGETETENTSSGVGAGVTAVAVLAALALLAVVLLARRRL